MQAPRKKYHYPEYKHQWYLKTTSKEKRMDEKDRLRFGGMKGTVLARDHNTCRDCDTTAKRLVVHHIDGHGYRDGDSVRNALVKNSLGNLVTLCHACHMKRHGSENPWSRAFDKCVICGGTDSRHCSNGVCQRCYDYYRSPTHHDGWSYLFDRCIVCGTTERKHHGNGMCKRCWQNDSRSKKRQQKI